MQDYLNELPWFYSMWRNYDSKTSFFPMSAQGLLGSDGALHMEAPECNNVYGGLACSTKTACANPPLYINSMPTYTPTNSVLVGLQFIAQEAIWLGVKTDAWTDKVEGYGSTLGIELQYCFVTISGGRFCTFGQSINQSYRGFTSLIRFNCTQASSP